jgi:hypothetical protein
VYATERETTIAGTNHTYWQMSGLVDLTDSSKRGVESDSWGTVKALYWVAGQSGR